MLIHEAGLPGPDLQEGLKILLRKLRFVRTWARSLGKCISENTGLSPKFSKGVSNKKDSEELNEHFNF